MLVTTLFLAKWGFKKVKEHWNLYGIELQKYVNPIHSETSFGKRESWLLFALTKVLAYVICFHPSSIINCDFMLHLNLFSYSIVFFNIFINITQKIKTREKVSG